MGKEQLEQIGYSILDSEFYQKYAYKHYWTSGCCTEVAPVTVNCDSIEIQLACKNLRGIKQALAKLVRQIGESLVKRYYVFKYDGSCPNVARIYFK